MVDGGNVRGRWKSNKFFTGASFQNYAFFEVSESESVNWEMVIVWPF